MLAAVRNVDGVTDPLAERHERTSAILAELRQARNRLTGGPSTLSPAIRALRRIEARLDRPLRLAVIGEFNSGKSSLANLLARSETLPTAVVSNTRIPTLLCYSGEPKIWAVDEHGQREWLRADQRVLPNSIFRLEVGLPTERLRTVQIIDLPGIADPKFHAPDIEAEVRDADAVLWCTVSTQAWKESERSAWRDLPARLRARGLLVATHADLLQDHRDADKLLQRLRGETGALFKDVVLVSTLWALALVGRQGNHAGEDAWRASGAEALDAALYRLLRNVRDRRAEAGLRVTARIANRALSQLDGQAT
jgi:predicted nucleic acid-binding protein